MPNSDKLGTDLFMNNIHKVILENISIALNFLSESVLQRSSQNMHIIENRTCQVMFESVIRP
jgi:hypothetical protein